MSAENCSHHIPVAQVTDSGQPCLPPEPGLLDDLMSANRVLFRHICVCDDKDPPRFLLSFNMASSAVTTGRAWDLRVSEMSPL